MRKKRTYLITVSHSVSGGRLWLYVVDVTFGATSRCVVVVLLAAYRINAPTNKPVNSKNSKHLSSSSSLLLTQHKLIFIWKIFLFITSIVCTFLFRLFVKQKKNRKVKRDDIFTKETMVRISSSR